MEIAACLGSLNLSDTSKLELDHTAFWQNYTYFDIYFRGTIISTIFAKNTEFKK